MFFVTQNRSECDATLYCSLAKTIASLRLICHTTLFEILAKPLDAKDDQIQNTPRKASILPGLPAFCASQGGKSTRKSYPCLTRE
jgi:hypothetical protein